MNNDRLHILVVRGPRQRMGRGAVSASSTTPAGAGAVEGMAPTAKASTSSESAT
jgi:hypothetical protein